VSAICATDLARDSGFDRATGVSRRGLLPVRRVAAALSVVTLAFVTFAVPAQAQRGVPDVAARITIDAKPIDVFYPSVGDQRRFGTLDFIGGLELKSSYSHFGGLSAIRVEADGEHFVSLSDKGHWLTGRIVYERGRPAGIADAVMAPMLGPDGRTLASRGWYDTESLAEQDGFLYVGIERANRIVRFDFAKFGVLAHAEVVPVPLGISKLPNNKGLEALIFAPRDSKLAGALVAFSERGLERRDEFDISDCALLPSGDVLLLERRFTWLTGIAMRLRRIALADIVPGALVDGPDLLFADMGYQIDNMEGLSIHAAADGSTILTMVSDDNFSILQRTILLQFKLTAD